MMSIMNYAVLFIILIGLGILHHLFEIKQNKLHEEENYEAIQQFLLTNGTRPDMDFGNPDKPLLWIYIPREYNARQWLSFGSRSSMELNQPYLYLCVKSIIEHCRHSFHICLIDDDSFEKLLPKSKIPELLSTAADPIRIKLRQLLFAELLYVYSGIFVPISFVCFRDLTPLWDMSEINKKPIVGEMISRHSFSASDADERFCPSPSAFLLSSHKKSQVLADYIDFLQRLISTDFTADSVIVGEISQWWKTQIVQGNVQLLPAKELGLATSPLSSSLDINDKISSDSIHEPPQPILLEDLLGQTPFDLSPTAYGILIPSEDILKRPHYEWFASLSAKEAIQADTMISRYLLLANAKESPQGKGAQELGVLKELIPEPPWVGFWKTPLITSWGTKPNYLGNNMRTLPIPYY